MSNKMHIYQGKEIVVTWNGKRCIHVAECIRRLGIVFDTRKVPWVQPDNADADTVADVVMHCPTGALHFQWTDTGMTEAIPAENTVEVSPNGPLYVRGDITIVDSDNEVQLRDTRVALCRCGASKGKPLCDGSHRQLKFRHVMSPEQIIAAPDTPQNAAGKMEIEPLENGPLMIKGNFRLRFSGADQDQMTSDRAFCRCGSSGTKPFCDGSHKKISFQSK